MFGYAALYHSGAVMGLVVYRYSRYVGYAALYHSNAVMGWRYMATRHASVTLRCIAQTPRWAKGPPSPEVYACIHSLPLNKVWFAEP